MKSSVHARNLESDWPSNGERRGHAILASKHRTTTYCGLVEYAAAGLHGFAFRLFRKYLPPNSKVLDLGSGEGAWTKRLHDASYKVTACDVLGWFPEPAREVRTGSDFPSPCIKADLNANFSNSFPKGEYDAISFIEVIEHLENPRHSFRQIAALLKDGGLVLVSTPNASGLYSRLRFFFTGQMAMFTDAAYALGPGKQLIRHSHTPITPLTAWQLEKIFMENGFSVLERAFHDAPFLPPKSAGDLAKVLAWAAFRPFMFGTIGGQSILYVLRKHS
jgi:2-polyprenyl-3-methyl-5-hydroxy-6-metoxy-1,4-benzoquinol methylase